MAMLIWLSCGINDREDRAAAPPTDGAGHEQRRRGLPESLFREHRLREVFGIAANAPLPKVNRESLMRFYEHLAECLVFPFEAKYYDAFEGATCDNVVIATRLFHPPESVRGAVRGIDCEVLVFGHPVTVRLIELRPSAANGNRQAIDDYQHWLRDSR